MKRFALSALALALCCAAASPQADDPNPLATARVFAFDQMTAKTSPSGSVGRSVFRGTLATGESVAVHETMQPAGMVPNPAHRIQHSEIILVQEGTLEFDHDGVTERADAGSVIYVALGTLHSVKNVGVGPVKYTVVQIGGDIKK